MKNQKLEFLPFFEVWSILQRSNATLMFEMLFFQKPIAIAFQNARDLQNRARNVFLVMF